MVPVEIGDLADVLAYVDPGEDDEDVAACVMDRADRIDFAFC